MPQLTGSILRGHGGFDRRSSFLTIAEWIVPVVGGVPRIESFSEFLQSALTGLSAESSIFIIFLQFSFNSSWLGISPASFQTSRV